MLGKKVIIIDPRNQQVIYQVTINNQKDTNLSESPSIHWIGPSWKLEVNDGACFATPPRTLLFELLSASFKSLSWTQVGCSRHSQSLSPSFSLVWVAGAPGRFPGWVQTKGERGSWEEKGHFINISDYRNNFSE